MIAPEAGGGKGLAKALDEEGAARNAGREQSIF